MALYQLQTYTASGDMDRTVNKLAVVDFKVLPVHLLQVLRKTEKLVFRLGF